MMMNKKLLAVAEEYLGKGGKDPRKFCGLSGSAPWCNAFICFVFSKAGMSKLYYGGKKVTYCPTSVKWCDANLAMVPIYLALPSDVIYFDWNNNGVPDHVGFVEKKISTEKIRTIEGNTNGGIVAKKTRPERYVLGVYRPHFSAKFNAGKKLKVDGAFGYNTIAVMQKAFGLKVDGVLKKSDIKALQNRAGVRQDGSWGPATSKAVQKMIRSAASGAFAVDGEFGPKSVKTMQIWLNERVFK